VTRVQRTYWVVSPNVRFRESTVDAWRRASVEVRAAFMGWSPKDPGHSYIGPKFAGEVSGGIEPGDVILIARRHAGSPEIVGFGVVVGQAKKRLTGFRPPASFGSLRMLRPFVPWSRPPANLPFAAAVEHIRSLVKLHPNTNKSHRKICLWMERHLRSQALQTGAKPRQIAKEQRSSRSKSGRRASHQTITILAPSRNNQLDYVVRTKNKIATAMKREARLLEQYRDWLARQSRKLPSVRYGALQCDGYEKVRGNLIEAKSSASREHIRMAVGQLLDYAFQGRTKLGDPSKAVLLPRKPASDIMRWLDSIGIKVIWPKRGAFLDNADGQFT
jgi:hypothetical protein